MGFASLVVLRARPVRLDAPSRAAGASAAAGVREFGSVSLDGKVRRPRGVVEGHRAASPER